MWALIIPQESDRIGFEKLYNGQDVEKILKCAHNCLRKIFMKITEAFAIYIFPLRVEFTFSIESVWQRNFLLFSFNFILI